MPLVCMYVCMYVCGTSVLNLNKPNLTRLSHKYSMSAVCLPITNCNMPFFGSSDRHASTLAYTSDILRNRTKVTVSCLCRSRFQEHKSYDALAYLRTEEGKIHTSILSNLQKPEHHGCVIPQAVELTGIINKPLLLHLVGCLYYLYQ